MKPKTIILHGHCPKCKKVNRFGIELEALTFGEHTEASVICGNPNCGKQFYVYMQVQPLISETNLEPIT